MQLLQRTSQRNKGRMRSKNCAVSWTVFSIPWSSQCTPSRGDWGPWSKQVTSVPSGFLHSMSLTYPNCIWLVFEGVPCHGCISGSRTLATESASLLVWLQSVWKNISKQKVQSRNWQQIKKASCNLGCGSQWQNWVFGVSVNFKSMLEDVSRIDRLHTPKLIHNILLMVWKSTSTCWSSSSEFQFSGTTSGDSIFFFFALKSIEEFLCKELHWKVVFRNHALFLLNLSQLRNRQFSAELQLYACLRFWFVFFSLLGALFIICILFTTVGVFWVPLFPHDLFSPSSGFLFYSDT